MRIKRKFPQIPWIAHFSDPWAGTPYPVRLKTIVTPFRRLFEKYVFEHADLVVFVSSALRTIASEKYPDWVKNKIVVLPHVFDPELYGESEHEEGEVFKLTYVGGLNQVRGIEPVKEAMEILKRNGTNLNRLKIQLVGQEMNREAEILNKVHPGLAETVGPVGYLDSLKLMKSADCLLVVDANLQYSPFFPSKLVDYLGSYRPVVGISPANSFSSTVLREQGFRVFGYGELVDFAGYLKEIMEHSISMPLPNREKIGRYSAQSVASIFLHLTDLARSNCVSSAK
jgi:hypothetical protein